MPEHKQANELRILSWNIQMLPRLIKRVHRGPLKRARLIAPYIEADSVDVIVFQEAFDVRARRILKRRLKDEYPYHAGPANKKFFRLKTNSGVMMFSKYPLEKLGTVVYDNGTGADHFAFKGAMVVQFEFNGKPIMVAGTHMQAGGTNPQKISQYQQMAGLLDKYSKDGVPMFICGDFNTAKNDTSLYPKMLKYMKADDGPIYGKLKYSVDSNVNGMHRGKGQKVIDYVLYRGNGVPYYYMFRSITLYKNRWSDQYDDLSDHNGVLMRVKFNK